MTNIWQLLTTMLIGFGIGWLLEKYVGSKKNLYMIFSLIIAFSLGVANFFIALYKKLKSIQEKNKPDPSKYIKYEDDEKEDEDN